MTYIYIYITYISEVASKIKSQRGCNKIIQTIKINITEMFYIQK